MFERMAEVHLADDCRKQTARSSAPICSDRPSRQGWPSALSPSRSSRASGSSSGCSSMRSKARSCFKARLGRASCRLKAKADRIDLLDDGTLRIIDYKLGRAPKTARALQLPIYGALCPAAARWQGTARQWPVSRAGYVAFKEKNAFVSIGSRHLEEALADGAAALPRRRSTGIERAAFRRVRDEPWLCTRCGYSRASAERTTSATSDVQLSLLRPRVVQLLDPWTMPMRNPRESRSRRRTPTKPASFAVDPRNNVVLEASAGTGKTSVLVARYVNLLKRGRRPGEHPGDHVHAQGGRRDARAHRRASCGTPARAVGDRRRALAGAARPARRHRHQHHRRVLPVAAARVSARSRCRSRLRSGGRDRGAAADRRGARSGAADPGRPGASSDADIALVLAQLGISRTREGLAALLDRRLVAWDALDRFLARGPRT